MDGVSEVVMKDSANLTSVAKSTDAKPNETTQDVPMDTMSHASSSQTQPVKKKSGFVITSVTDSGHGRPPSILRDGEESADDLDESHASYSDISYSRTTDADHDQESTASEDTLNISTHEGVYPSVNKQHAGSQQHALKPIQTANHITGYMNSIAESESNIHHNKHRKDRPPVLATNTQESIQELPHDHQPTKVEDVKMTDVSTNLQTAAGGVQKSAASRNLPAKVKLQAAPQQPAPKSDRPTALSAATGPGRVYRIVKREHPAKRSRGRWSCLDYSDAKTPMVSQPLTDGKFSYGDSGLQHSDSMSSMVGNQNVLHSSSSSSVNWDMTNRQLLLNNEGKRRSIEERNHLSFPLRPDVLNTAIMKQYASSDANATEDGGEPSRSGRIDNKIEAAMDLVKKHLMSAVRDEVDELKEKINKLNDEVALMRDMMTEEQLAALQIALNAKENKQQVASQRSTVQNSVSQGQFPRGQGQVMSPPQPQQNNNIHPVTTPVAPQQPNMPAQVDGPNKNIPQGLATAHQPQVDPNSYTPHDPTPNAQKGFS